MTTQLNSLFSAANNQANVGTSRTLSGTQELTNIASSLTDQVIEAVASQPEEYSTKVTESQQDMMVLDELITIGCTLEDINIDFLKDIGKDELESMLKSQQSKRSRCKGKTMTMDNYKSMMTAAIAESLIRMALGKDKNTFVGRSGMTTYDEETLEKLSIDQDKLRKEIRNVQSKKSIMKSKAGFSEGDDRWQQLLVAEEQLKGIRTSTGTSKTVIVDETRDRLKELLAEVNPASTKASDLKEIMNTIKDMVFADVTEELVDDQEEA